MLDSLLSRRLIFVTGKGGVGKSTACAALGLALAKRGRNVLVVETDTYSAMADLFHTALPPSTITRARDHLSLVNLDSENALIHAITQFVPSERVARTVIQNRVASLFFKAAPSVNEFSILNMVRFYLEEKTGSKHTYDHIIVDLPASGHAVTFLNVPDTLNGMIRVGRFAQICQELGEMIRDPRRTSLIAVCLPEEMPVNETVELSQAIKETLGRELSLVLLNMVHTEPLSSTYRALFQSLSQPIQHHALSDLDALAPGERVVRGASLALEWHERDQKYIRQLTLRLAKGIELIELPMLYEREGQRVIKRLAAFLNNEDDGRLDELAS